jgi:hypothetical protein
MHANFGFLRLADWRGTSAHSIRVEMLQDPFRVGAPRTLALQL